MGTLSAALEAMNTAKTSNLTPKSDKIVLLHYSKLQRSKFQYSDKGKTPEEFHNEVLNLAADLRVDGRILQPLVVRKIGTDLYEILVGHHRREASKYNVEVEGLTEFEFCPCIIVNLTDAQAEYLCNSSNSRWEKTEWHIMHEIETKKRLLEECPEDFPHLQGPGRMIDKLAKEMNMAKSTVGEYLQISNNLSNKGMEAFEKKVLNKSAAVSMASLPHEEQDMLLDAGVTKQKDIKAYKEENVKKTIHRTNVTDAVKTTKIVNVENSIPVNPPAVSAEVVDVLPGQYRVANTDMEIEETVPPVIVEEEAAAKEIRKIQGRCTCPNCKLPSRIEDTFKFFNKRYCMNCLYDLIKDLADTGVISLDYLSIDKDGIIVRS